MVFMGFFNRSCLDGSWDRSGQTSGYKGGVRLGRLRQATKGLKFAVFMILMPPELLGLRTFNNLNPDSN